MVLTEDEACRYYEQNDASHSFEHVLRVVALAERIARAEGADLDIVHTAALLHDIGRGEESRTGVCHAEVGAEQARRILQGQSCEFVEAVAGAIATHRFRKQLKPETPEAKVLYDADKLDAIGAIGVARAYAVAGRRGQLLWSPLEDPGTPGTLAASGEDDGDSESHTPVKEFTFKLCRLKDGMLTATGWSMAAERHAFMVDFFNRLEREVRGEL